MGLFNKKKQVFVDNSSRNNPSTLKNEVEITSIPSEGISSQGNNNVNHAASMSTSFDVSHATHFEPKSYAETKHIADTLMRFKNVTVSFLDIVKEEKKRVIDFLTGVMYGLDGDYKKVDTGIFYFWIN